ncbi:MAG TPA: leucyl aminopeptidase [Nitrososphaeraceae archaeon]|jgi:leucyl aminopeptidase|nr:leucyl aminopeptidase [Nitrososphaeraceae archaeon]
MLKIIADETKISEKRTDLLVIGCFLNEDYSNLLNKLNEEISIAGKEIISSIHKFGLLKELHTFSKLPARKILFVGLGNKNEFNTEKSRNISGKIIQYAKEFRITELSIIPFNFSKEIIESLVEGIILSSYSFEKFKTSKNNNTVDNVSILIESNSKEYQKIINDISVICQSVNFGRDISNLPPNECSPEYLAKIALEIKNQGIEAQIIGINSLKDMGLNGIVSVGSGSINTPKLIVLKYKGTKNGEDPILLVGKAVTFDSGGISIKPSEKMEEMKFDKCGGVNVLAIMKSLSSLKIKHNVIGIIPAVENMPSNSSYRPSDIINMYNGKSVEVINTDAEGRLILADALAFGIKQYKPKLIIDMATLTGACIIALGNNIAGIIGNDEKLIKKILDISKVTHEKMWELPLLEDHHDQIKSKNADIKNIGGRPAGAITAAAFLSNFVGKTPWVHLDIAGTAWNQEGSMLKSYNPPGATGFGIRTIIKFIMGESIKL